MAIVVRDRVWAKSSELQEMVGDGWSIALLLVPSGDVAAAEEAALASYFEVQEARDALADQPATGVAAGFVGEWSWVRVKDGLRIAVSECEDPQTTFRAFTAAMERRGVAGVLDVWDRPSAVVAPSYADLLACRVRVRGHRLDKGDRAYWWDPDPDALGVVVRTAQAWWSKLPAAARSMRATAGVVPLDEGEDAAERILAYIAESLTAVMFATDGNLFRAIGVTATGTVTLAVGAAPMGAERWVAKADELSEVLRGLAGLAVYGRMWRGWDVEQGTHSRRAAVASL